MRSLATTLAIMLLLSGWWCVPAARAEDALQADAGTPEDEAAGRSEPQGALAWFKRGVELSRQGDYRAALNRFEKARDLSPTWALPHLEIAVAHMRTDNNRAIIGSELYEAVRLGKDIPRAHYLYGVFLQEAGKRDEAIQLLTRALALRSSMVDARYRLATLYVEAGKQDLGTEQYRLVLEQRSGHLGAMRNLAVLYEQSGRLEEAEDLLQTITRLFPDNAYHLANLARFYERVGWEKKARQARRRAERIEPTGSRRHLRPLLKSRDLRRRHAPGDSRQVD